MDLPILPPLQVLELDLLETAKNTVTLPTLNHIRCFHFKDSFYINLFCMWWTKYFHYSESGEVRGELTGVSFPFSHVSFRDCWESIFALSHLGSHIHRFQGFIYFSRLISERFQYVPVCMCICLVIALPLEATDGPCLLFSRGRRL